MKTHTFISAFAFVSAVVALPGQAPAYVPPETSIENSQQDAVPQFSGDKKPQGQIEGYGIPGSKSGSGRHGIPQQFGSKEGPHGFGTEAGVHEEGPENIFPLSQEHGHYTPQGNDNQPQDTEDQVSPLSQRPGGIGAQGGVPYPIQPGSIGGIGPGGIGSPSIGGSGGQCVSQEEAEQFIEDYNRIVTGQPDAKEIADRIIGEGFHVTTSSINTIQAELEGKQGPDVAASRGAHSKEEWIGIIVNNPPLEDVQTLKVLVFCDQVLQYRRMIKQRDQPYPILGFNLFTLRRGDSIDDQNSDDQSQYDQSSSSPFGFGNGGSGGSGVQAVLLETEWDSLAYALSCGLTCQAPADNGQQPQGDNGQQI